MLIEHVCKLVVIVFLARKQTLTNKEYAEEVESYAKVNKGKLKVNSDGILYKTKFSEPVDPTKQVVGHLSNVYPL